MKFEGREIPPYAEPLSSADLKEGCVYYMIHYADDALLIPTMETVVFIGRDLEPEDSGQVYFQDIESHRKGVKYEDPPDGTPITFFAGSENESGAIFDYEHALDSLIDCSLRRKRRGM